MTHTLLVKEDGSSDALQIVDVAAGQFDEAWLQELLRRHPEILPVGEIEPIFAPLVSVGREVSTDAGSIDNLFMSPAGYPVIVETKLWRNPEARREVVAQLIDYAAAVSKWDYAAIDRAARRYSSQYEGEELSLAQLIQRKHGPLESGFERTVARSLKLSRFLLLIVGDTIQESVVDMLSYVNRRPSLAMDVALVELPCYRSINATWPVFVAPRLVGHTRIVERAIVEVNIVGAPGAEVEVRQDRLVDLGATRKRQFLKSEEAFWELLREHDREAERAARRLVAALLEVADCRLSPREASVVLELSIPGSGVLLSLLFIDKSGTIRFWPGALGRRLAKAGFPQGVQEAFEKKMRELLHAPSSRTEPSSSVLDVDATRLRKTVEDFAAQLQEAASALG